MTEILKGGADVVSTRKDMVSDPSPEGLRTIVNLQYVGDTPYFSAGGFEDVPSSASMPAK